MAAAPATSPSASAPAAATTAAPTPPAASEPAPAPESYNISPDHHPEPVVYGQPLPGVPQDLPPGSPESKARATLENLLQASTPEELEPLVHQPTEALRLADALYPDGNLKPTPYRKILFDGGQQVPGSTHKTRLFRVVTDTNPMGFPVAVQDTDSGPRIDFTAFAQCRDELLDKFMNTPSAPPSKFLVVLRRGHYFGDKLTDEEQSRLLCLEVSSPNPASAKYSVFVPRGTALGKAALGKYAWDKIYTPTVELTHADRHVAISSIVQDTWQPEQKR